MNTWQYHNVYFLGIGGIGMSALARWFHRKGVNVSGYDRTQTRLTEELILEGIRVHYEDSLDNIPVEVKKRRLQEIIEKQNELSRVSFAQDLGKTYKVLIDGDSKRSADDWVGRTSQNKVVIFPKNNTDLQKGDYVEVKVKDCTQATLFGEII